MKNNLSILIENYQQEVKYLELEMKRCVQELDYERAAVFREALAYTKQQLYLLQHLENPKLEEIDRIKFEIRCCDERIKLYKDFDQKVENLEQELEEYRQSLARMENAGPAPYLDSDELLISLERLQTADIKFVELEINPLVCQLKGWKGLWQVDIQVQDPDKLNRFLTSRSKRVLRQLGFEFKGETSQALLGKLTEVSSLEVLSWLSVVLYEGFRLYGNKTALIRYVEG